MLWQITIGRDGDDLVISNDHTATYVLSEDEATWPSFSMRREYAPDSLELGGRQIMGTVRNQGQQSVGIYVQADSTTELVAAMEVLEAATSQLTYTYTNNIDGVSRTYEAHAELPQWGSFDSGLTKAHMSKATIVIPLNPAVS